LETEETNYIPYAEAVYLHIILMRLAGETRYGVFVPDLIESALARPQNAAIYESADVIRQAATLCFGLIKNHPWVGGNKRTATSLTDEFLLRNGYILHASRAEHIELSLAVESDRFGVDEIETWLRPRVTRRK
jgi:death-on-curing protein